MNTITQIKTDLNNLVNEAAKELQLDSIPFYVEITPPNDETTLYNFYLCAEGSDYKVLVHWDDNTENFNDELCRELYSILVGEFDEFAKEFDLAIKVTDVQSNIPVLLKGLEEIMHFATYSDNTETRKILNDNALVYIEAIRNQLDNK